MKLICLEKKTSLNFLVVFITTATVFFLIFKYENQQNNAIKPRKKRNTNEKVNEIWCELKKHNKSKSICLKTANEIYLPFKFFLKDKFDVSIKSF